MLTVLEKATSTIQTIHQINFPAMPREAFVTLATNDVYCKGALVLAQSLKCHGTQKELVVLITPQVSPDSRMLLEFFFDHVISVNILDSEDATHLSLLKRPELGVTFTKLHCWSLTQYDKCVFLDADTMALCNVDELFEHQELSAAPDSGWPDMFNSGVFVYQPSMQTYLALIKLADEEGSFDGGDQGLLNTYFNQWRTADAKKRLSFLYNMHSTSSYTYTPAFARFGHATKIVHFIGAVKPWHHKYNSENGCLEQVDGDGIHEENFLLQWWRHLTTANKLFMDSHDQVYHAPITCESGSYHAPITTPSRDDHAQSTPPPTQNPCHVTHSPASKTPRESPQPTKDPLAEERARHAQWRSAQIDFSGKDCFENIREKMDRILVGESPPNEKEPTSVCDVTPSTDVTPKDDVTPSPDVTTDTKGRCPENDKVEEGVLVSTLADLQRWQFGSIDYHGQDSFNKIQAKLDQIMIQSSADASDSKEAMASISSAETTTDSNNNTDSSNTNNNNSSKFILPSDAGSFGFKPLAPSPVGQVLSGNLPTTIPRASVAPPGGESKGQGSIKKVPTIRVESTPKNGKKTKFSPLTPKVAPETNKNPTTPAKIDTQPPKVVSQPPKVTQAPKVVSQPPTVVSQSPNVSQAPKVVSQPPTVVSQSPNVSQAQKVVPKVPEIPKQVPKEAQDTEMVPKPPKVSPEPPTVLSSPTVKPK